MNEKEKKRKYLKRKKHKRLLRYFVLLVVILSVLAVSGYVLVHAVQTGVFNIKTIEVEGNEIVDKNEVIEASGIHEGDNIFFADINQAHYNIEMLVNLESLEIHKVMPDKIIIKMQEVPVIAAINWENKIYYIGSKSILVEDSDYLKKTDIPLITGFSDIHIQDVGQQVTLNPDWKFDTVMNILRSFEKDDVLSKISEVGITSDNTYRIITKNNVIMTVKDYDNFNASKDYILGVIKQNKSNLDIDLTSGTNPVIKARNKT